MANELKQKARRWAFTWNNYADDEVQRLKNLSAEKVDYLIFGYEIAPTTGTKHLQGYVEFSTPLAGTTAKSRLDPVKKSKSAVSVRRCEGTREENIAYVRKAESKDPAFLDEAGAPVIEEITHVEPKQGHRSDWDIFYEFLCCNPDYDKFAEKFPEIAIKYHGGIEKIIRGLKNKAMIEAVRKKYEGVTLRPWQQRLIDEVKLPADDRKIIWYYDEVGGSGKTWTSKLLFVEFGAAYFTNSKSADIAYAYNGEPIVVFDFSRSNEESINYGAIETVKNGIMFSGKYEARTKMFACPHVIVMANFAPNMAKLSMDRWDIRVPLSIDSLPLESVTNDECLDIVPGGNTGCIQPEPQAENTVEAEEIFVESDGTALEEYWGLHLM